MILTPFFNLNLKEILLVRYVDRATMRMNDIHFSPLNYEEVGDRDTSNSQKRRTLEYVIPPINYS